jgi:hypothetical protein
MQNEQKRPTQEKREPPESERLVDAVLGNLNEC